MARQVEALELMGLPLVMGVGKKGAQGGYPAPQHWEAHFADITEEIYWAFSLKTR